MASKKQFYYSKEHVPGNLVGGHTTKTFIALKVWNDQLN